MSYLLLYLIVTILTCGGAALSGGLAGVDAAYGEWESAFGWLALCGVVMAVGGGLVYWIALSGLK